MRNKIWQIIDLYYDGFKNMRLGKTLWLIIILKIILIYGVLKMFVFDQNFKTLYPTDSQKTQFVLDHLTQGK